MKTSNNKPVEILQGSISKNLILFALPIALSAMLQQLFNSADTAVVGRFADANALGAVGTNGEIVGFLVSLSAGLAVGANVIAAYLIGSGKREQIKTTVHTSIAIALVFGIFTGFIGQFLAKPILRGIKVSPEILDLSVTYLRLYFASYPFLLLYDFASALLRSKGDSRRPFLALLFSGILNVGLNLIFVIVFKMGVLGVGLATLFATIFSAAVVLYWLATEEEDFRLSVKRISFDRSQSAKILKIGVPAAIQGAVFCLANIIVQSAVNGFGAIATAGNSISVTFEYFAYYMGEAFGQTATTFISQNYAAKNHKRCDSIFTYSLIWALFFSLIITMPLCIWKNQVSSLFTTDQNALKYAVTRIMTILVFQPVSCIFLIPAGTIRGYGHSTLPSIVTLLGICAVRVIWVLFIFPRINTYQGLLIAHTMSWFITSFAMNICYICVRKKIRSQVSN